LEREELKISRRDVTGKKVRFLRREGVIPANLYGPGIESVPLQAETAVLKRLLLKVGRDALISLKVDGDKKPRMVMLRDIQRDPLTGNLLHIDLFQVEMTHKVRADVPILFVGEAPAAKSSRVMLIESLTELHVEALPADLPPHIEVDLSALEEIDQAIHVRDIAAGDGVEVLTDPDQVIARVMESKVEVIEEVVEEVEEVEAEEEEEAAAEKAAAGPEAEAESE
jgi:large subunit ribosomal protein L25